MSVLYNINYKLVNGKRVLVGFQTLELTQQLNTQKIVSEMLDPNGNVTYSIFMDEINHEDVLEQIQEILDQEVDDRK